MSFPQYPEYKDSGVEWLGEVPAHWEVEDLKYRCEIIPSNVDKKSHSDEPPVQLCNYTDVYYNTRITSDLAFMRATARKAEIDKFQLKPDDVVITKDSETADDIAVPAIITGELPGVLCGYHLAIIRARGFASGPFVNYLFQSHSLRYYFEITARGLTRVGLSESAIGNSEIAWPELNEQRRVAAFLDYETARIDALIEEQKRLIELLKEKRQAVISHAVTKGLDPDVPMKESGGEWLGEVPEHWGISRLKFFVELATGITPPSEDLSNYSESGWPWVRPDDLDDSGSPVRASKFLTDQGWSYCRPVSSGATLVCCIGSIGKLGYTTKVICTNQQITAVQPYRNSRYLFYLIYASKSELDSRAAGNVLRILNGERLGNVPVAMPPTDEAKKIAVFLDQETARIDKLVEEGESVIKLLRERRSALISAAVTGKIDVRNWQAPAESERETYPIAAEPEAAYQATRS